MVKSKQHSYTQIVLGILFIIWGIICAIWSDFPGSPFLAIAGVFIIYGGIEHYYRYNYLTNLVANVLASNPRTNLRQLSQETRLKEKTVLRILTYLKAEGRLKSTYDPATGDLIVYEIDGFKPFERGTPSPTISQIQQPQLYQTDTNPPQNQYLQGPPEISYPICPYCGAVVPPEARFCPNCGASLK